MPEYIHLTQTHSTNLYLRQILESNPLVEEGLVIYADFQDAGRGQQGNSWESEAKKNILCSLLLYPRRINAQDQFIISEIVSLGIADTLNSIQDGFAIKWPNDIYYGDKKVAGILIENDLSGKVIYDSIIGFGINVNQEEFKSDAPNPLSLFQLTGQHFDCEQLLRSIINRIFHYYDLALKGDTSRIHSLYMESLYRKDGCHLFSDGQKHFEAEIAQIDPTGMITLAEKDGNKRVFAFKEVEFII